MKSGVLILLVSCVLPLAAHHSFAAEFDDKQPVKLDGTVVKFDFMNPHSWIYLDVKNPDGATVRWSVETGSTNALFRRGWRKESLRPGDHITIDAFRAKDGSKHSQCQHSEAAGRASGQRSILTRWFQVA